MVFCSACSSPLVIKLVYAVRVRWDEPHLGSHAQDNEAKLPSYCALTSPRCSTTVIGLHLQQVDVDIIHVPRSDLRALNFWQRHSCCILWVPNVDTMANLTPMVRGPWCSLQDSQNLHPKQSVREIVTVARNLQVCCIQPWEAMSGVQNGHSLAMQNTP